MNGQKKTSAMIADGKRLNDRDPWRVDMTFMTNADVPTLAVQGVIDNPINPFTGKAISNEIKEKEPMLVTTSDNWEIDHDNGCVFDTSDGTWWSVHDNIFDLNNWTRVE